MALVGIVASTNIEMDASFGPVIEKRDAVVASAVVRDGRLRPADVPNIRREHFAFAHEGRIEDIATLRKRISPRRALQITTNEDAESLFAYLLTCVDGAANADVGLMRSVSDIASSGLRGNFNFMLSTEQALYAHRGRDPLGLTERADALIVSPPIGSSRWRVLSPGSLIRLNRGASPSWRILLGALDASEPELPFTD